MRILHIDETFHPSFGYQCNPLAKFQQQAGHEVHIIAPEAEYIHRVYHDFGEYGENLETDDMLYVEATGVKIKRVPGKGFIAGRLNYDMKALYCAIEEINPDAIMVHCIETLTAIRLIRGLRNKYPMVFDSHMLSMASKNKFAKLYEFFYKLYVTSIIKKEAYRVIKTQNDDYVTEHLGIPEEQTRFISFGTDTILFKPNIDSRKKFCIEYGISEDAFIITSTGKLSEAKDGILFANAVKNGFSSDREVVVVIVADFSGEYEKQVKAILDESNNKILFFDIQKYLNLPWFYQIADVVVFPKQCSMSFYDAQSCGTPVISEMGRVNEERNSHGNGFCFKNGSVESLVSTLEKVMNMPEEKYLKMRENSRDFVKENYSYETIAELYTKELEDSIVRFNKRHKIGGI